MKLLPNLIPASVAAVALASLALSSCSAPSSSQSNHWRIDSIGPRISYHFFGYDGTKDGTALEYGRREAGSLSKTLKRRLLGINPDNPLTSEL